MGALLGIRLGKEFGLDESQTAEVAASTPSDLFAAGARIAWFKSDTGVTSSSSRISAWTNVWSNGNLAQATGANQPLLATSIFGSLPAVYLDSATRIMTATLTSAVLSGERLYMWTMLRLPASYNVNANVTRISNAAGTRQYSHGTGTSGTARWRAQYNNGTSANILSSAVNDTQQRLLEGGFTAATADNFLVSTAALGTGGTSATDTNLDTIVIGSATVATPSYLAEWVIVRGEPTTTVKKQMWRYFQSRYIQI